MTVGNLASIPHQKARWIQVRVIDSSSGSAWPGLSDGFMKTDELYLHRAATAPTRPASSWLARSTRIAGPFAPLVQMLLIGLVLLSGFRLAMLA